jgi:hypothetical protein
MNDEMIGESLVERAKFVFAVREYQIKRTSKKENIVDFSVSPAESDDRIFVRVITEPRTSSGCVRADTVLKISQILHKKHYDKGILIGKRFTQAAIKEINKKDIEIVTKEIPNFRPERLYSAIQDHVNKLCKEKCGRIPRKESECKGYSDGGYSCNVRLISDDAYFHFKHGWTSLLERDLAKLLAKEEDLSG